MVSKKFMVVTYPPRLEMAKKLAEDIGGDVEIFVDEQCQGIKWSHFQSWKKGLESGDDWICLMQDDAILCNDFRRKAEARIEEAEKLGYRFFQFFNFRMWPEDRLEERWDIYPGGDVMCDLANVFRYDLLRKFLRFYESKYDEYKKTYCDSILQDFMKVSEINGISTLPHLIDHNVDVKSSIGTGAKIFGWYRTSKCFSKEGD